MRRSGRPRSRACKSLSPWLAAGGIRRIGKELVEGARFYGSSYFREPRGEIVAQASDREDELLVADLDLGSIDEVRTTRLFFRDRRPETYREVAELRP